MYYAASVFHRKMIYITIIFNVIVRYKKGFYFLALNLKFSKDS